MADGTSQTQTAARRRIVLLTGLSGAGKTTALKALEDIGFDAVDNLPFHLLDALLDDPLAERLAVGIDVRTRGFDADALLAIKHRMAGAGDTDVTMVYLDCDDDTMVRRFTETRRRHLLNIFAQISTHSPHPGDMQRLVCLQSRK